MGLRDQARRREGDQVRVLSRNGRDWTDRVPLIAEAVRALRVESVTIDGEGVVCRPDGVSDFDLLRASVGRTGSRDTFLYAFDLLELDGNVLRREPWEVPVLASLLRKPGDGIRLSEHLARADGDQAFRARVRGHRRQAPRPAVWSARLPPLGR